MFEKYGSLFSKLCSKKCISHSCSCQIGGKCVLIDPPLVLVFINSCYVRDRTRVESNPQPLGSKSRVLDHSAPGDDPPWDHPQGMIPPGPRGICPGWPWTHLGPGFTRALGPGPNALCSLYNARCALRPCYCLCGHELPRCRTPSIGDQ